LDRDALRALLIKHEGLRLEVYNDSEGQPTIGVGRCLSTNGVTEAEAMYLLENDLSNVVAHARDTYAWFNRLNDDRQNVVCDMIFALGEHGFAEFKNLIAAIEVQDYTAASNQILCSRWAGQVGSRAAELAALMMTEPFIH
jgi:lysozyme